MNEWISSISSSIIRSAGFVNSSMIRSQNALNFAYILYLALRDLEVPYGDIEHYVRQWFVMSILTGRYSGSPEATFDYDIRQIHSQGIAAYAEWTNPGELSDAFWEDYVASGNGYLCGVKPILPSISRRLRLKQMIEDSYQGYQDSRPH